MLSVGCVQPSAVIFKVCAPVPLGAASLAAAMHDEDALVELLYPVSFASTKARVESVKYTRKTGLIKCKSARHYSSGHLHCSKKRALRKPGW